MEDDLLDGESGYGEYASSGEESGYFGNLRRGISGRLRKEDEEHGGTRRLVALRVLSRASTDSMISQLEMVQARLNAAGNFAEDWIFRLIYVTVGCVCLRAIIWHARDFCPGKAGDPGNPFAGESGRVVTWLKVEAVAALGLPTFNMMVRMSGLTRDVTAWCVLYLLALFQTAWFLLGSVWSLSSAVPTACRLGGDSTAFETMWWISALWLLAVLCTGVVSSFVGCYQLYQTRSLWIAAREWRRTGQEAALRGTERNADEMTDSGDEDGADETGRLLRCVAP